MKSSFLEGSFTFILFFLLPSSVGCGLGKAALASFLVGVAGVGFILSGSYDRLTDGGRMRRMGWWPTGATCLRRKILRRVCKGR